MIDALSSYLVVGRLTLAASMLRTIKQLKEKYLIVHPEGESDDSDVDDDIDINDDVNIC